MSEAALRLGRLRREGADSLHARMPDAGKPERRLADACLAFEHEYRGPFAHVVHESGLGGELVLPADDLGHHSSL